MFGALAAVLLSTTSALAAKIAIVTPYLAQPGTQYYVEAFQEVAKANGWSVNVVDTKGDVAAVISRIEDAANQKVDAIVLNADPGPGRPRGWRRPSRRACRCSAWTPGASPLLVANVTSNGYEMAATTATYVVNRIGGQGRRGDVRVRRLPARAGARRRRRRDLQEQSRHQDHRPA